MPGSPTTFFFLLAGDEFRIELTGSTQKMFPDKNNVWVVYYAVYNPPGNSVEIKFYIDSELKRTKNTNPIARTFDLNIDF